MSEAVFRFLPGEKVLQIVGFPGPDTDDCEILVDDGEGKVLVRYQVYGRGPFYENAIPRSNILWLKGSETSKRFLEWSRQRAPLNEKD